MWTVPGDSVVSAGEGSSMSTRWSPRASAWLARGGRFTSRSPAYEVLVAGQAGTAWEEGTRLSLDLARLDARATLDVAEVAGAADAVILARIAEPAASGAAADPVVTREADAAGVPAALADARFAALAARDAGSGPIAAAGQAEIRAALAAERTNLVTCGALGAAADVSGIVAVAAAALLIGVAAALAAPEPGEVVEAAGGAIPSPTGRSVAAAGVAGSGKLDAGAADSPTAGAAGAGGSFLRATGG
jgi:hypothetical protein